MGPTRTRPEFSLDEVIENLQRESDAAILTARAVLGASDGARTLDVPRRFPEVSPDGLSDVFADVFADVLADAEQRRGAASERHPARPA